MLSKEDMAIRLIEERSRLGYSQQNFAHQTNKTREQLRLYEIGKTALSTDFLAHASQLGLDVQYVITGIPSINTNGVISLESEKETQEEKTVQTATTVNGDMENSVIAGAGSTVNNINTTKHVTKTVAEVKPGKDHITEEQQQILMRLVKEIVKLEEMYRTKKSAKSYQAVWSSLNSHCKVASYKLIPLSKFEKARTYLQVWIGRLNSMKSAPKKNSTAWRKKRYSYIHTNVQQFGLSKWKEEYLDDKFNVDSITLLSDDELDKFYRAVAYQKRKNN